MRRTLIGFVVLVLTLFIAAQIQPASAQEPLDESIWSGPIDAVSENVSQQQVVDAQCTKADASLRYYKSTTGTDVTDYSKLDSILATETARDTRNYCIVQNQNGAFAGDRWAPDGNLTNAIYIDFNGGSIIPVPASKSYIVRRVYGSDPYGTFRASISSRFEQNGEMFLRSVGSGIGTRYYRAWRQTYIEPTLTHSDGNPFLTRSWGFSSNGRYAVLALNSGHIVQINLQTQDITPVAKLSSAPNSWSLAVSNDGDYVYTYAPGASNPTLHDLTKCSSVYAEGRLPNGTIDYSGCESKSLADLVSQSGVSGNNKSYAYPNFSHNSASLSFFTTVNNSDNTYVYYLTTLKPQNYIPSNQGYLATGDSFSSGEGDTQGGDWYESGTDEQGNIDTFAGRNLCHLSRRSYPYLMAIELGYLTTNAVSPPADGLFHSVACSGAKIHNIVGVLGEKQDNGGSEDFVYTDNQYRFNENISLLAWQPGAVSQKVFLNGSDIASGVERISFEPESITLGISGNDVGFGDIIKTCAISVGTCKQAVPESLDASKLALTIASQRSRLVSAYEQIKLSSPDARVYIHGYPVFVQGYNGNCGTNVRLNSQETALVEEGVKYLNAVIKSAAAEAGVFYVDITNILNGVNLCSGADDNAIAANGATLGNDIGLDIGVNLCFFRSGCLGKESFHPNSRAQLLYQRAILDQTDNMQASMPAAEDKLIPIPQQFFGEAAQNEIINRNGGSDFTVTIPEPKLATSVNDQSINIYQEQVLPNSKVEVSVESDPIIVGEYQVDSEGRVDINFTLPEELEPGSHEIHLKGFDRFGNKFDWYEPILVGHSIQDFDGDGILNDADPCKTIENSNIDVDEDGIDDACDGEITSAPEPPPDPEPEPNPSPEPISPLKSLINKLLRFLVFVFSRWSF